MGKTINAISLWQPWATLIAVGAKKFETRSWSTNYRGDLLICSSKRKVNGLVWDIMKSHLYQSELLKAFPNRTPSAFSDAGIVFPDELPYGMALCVVTLVDCISTEYPFLALGDTEEEAKREMEFGDYSPGRFAWRLENVRQLNPFHIKGKQSLFVVDYDLVQNAMKGVSDEKK